MHRMCRGLHHQGGADVMNITSNINVIVGNLRKKIELSTEPGGNVDALLRTIATNLHAKVKDRVHVQGIAADGKAIGTYSSGYMAVRTGVFKSNDTVSRGKNKGETKKTGVFTKGKNKGQARPNYNRTGDTKVIASLTRQVENDFSVIASGKGYGLGYNNNENFKKAGYVEATYKKNIFKLTEDEKELVKQTAQEFIDKQVNG